MEQKEKRGRIFRKILKFVGWFAASIVLLLLLIALAIQLPPVQNAITQKAISFLEEKIGTRVELGHISISFPKKIVLEDLYLEDQKKDTLLYAGKFSVDTDLLGLLRNEIELNDISLENARAYVSRPENDSAYNFSYILKSFAGDSTAMPDTLEEKGWKFSVEDIGLEDIRARYHDHLTGNMVDLSLGTFDVSFSEFDLENMKIIVDEISLADTRADVAQLKLPEVTEEVAEEKQPFEYDIGVAEVQLENIVANFSQEALGTFIRLDLGKSLLETKAIDLKQNRIDLDRFSLENTFFSVQQRPVAATTEQRVDPEPVAEKQSEAARPWVISLNALDLSDNSIQLYDFSKTHTKGAVDFDHLWLTNLNASAQDITIDGMKIQAEVKDLSLREKSGFVIRQLAALINIGEKKAELSGLRLLTGNSRLEADLKATFPDIERISEHPDQVNFNADINNTSLSLRDAIYFSPGISARLKMPSNSRISVDGAVRGNLANLIIEHFNLRALNDTYLATSGTVRGLPDTKALRMHLVVKKFYTTRNDVASILPDTVLPESMNLPEWISLEAVYDGSLTKAEFDTRLTSSIGNISLKGAADLDSTSAGRGIDARLAVDNFDVGELLGQPDTIGIVNLEASADVTGLRPEEMEGKVYALVKDMSYKQYTYRNLRLDGTIDGGIYDGVVTMNDPNLEFRLEGDLDYSGEVPQYNLTFDLRNADFMALHLTKDPFKARGILMTNIATDDFVRLNGNLGLRKVAIFDGEKLYAVDSLLFASIDQEGKSELKIDSDLLSGYFEGSFNIFSLADVVKEYFSTYYSIHNSTMVPKKDGGRQYFDFNLKLKKTELLTDILIPQLETFVPGEIRGTFDSETKQLDMRIDIADIQYANIGVKSFLLSTNSDESKLNYNILADQIRIDSLLIDGLEFRGTVANDSILTALVILDSLDKEKYLLGGVFQSLENQYQFSFLPDQVMLNYADWTVPKDNFIRFGGPRIIAQNLHLVNGREQIIVDSRGNGGSTLFVGFRELNLEYLVSMVSREKAASGLLHGDIFIVPDTANMTFTADIGIRDLNISEIPWGDLTLSVDRKTADRFDVDLGLKSNVNNLTATGYYITGENPAMDVTATIAKFELKTAEPLTMGQLKDMKGLLTGEVRVQGSPSKPQVRGRLDLDDVSFFSNYVNTSFTLDNETISLTDNGVRFDEFDIIDARKNKATIDGLIQTTDYKRFAFDLDVVTNNFRLLNTTEKDNELFYGRVDVDATIQLRGDMDEPNVTMQVGLGEDSRLTYVVPQAEAGVMEAEGIVRFVDKTFANDKFMKAIDPADTVKSSFKGLNLTARIELTDAEEFTVIIDPTTGDQLKVKGNTTLTLNMDPTGDLNLTGRYEITEGSYNLSFYKFLKREFRIAQGSTMTWSGDPLNARMDISAIYDVETAPIDLMSASVQSESEETLTRYKQKLPFMVFLNIKGELLKPEISFRLDMAESAQDYDQGNVYSRIRDINTREADLNKQVFALLLLKRFISDNPFENQGATGIEGTARTSVSKLLTEQLNKLSENVRGVELSFDLKSYEDYSSGQKEGQTQLQLGLSKNLFNDKLVVKVAGNVGIEGEDTSDDVTDYIGDLALEYKVTDDGRFRITGFRSSDYDMIDGQLTETGVGVIYVKDYNVLSELFKANENKKKK